VVLFTLPPLPADSDAERAHRKWGLYARRPRGLFRNCNDKCSPTSAGGHQIRKDKDEDENNDRDKDMPRSSNTVHYSHPSVPLQYVSFIEICCLRASLMPKISNAKILSNANL
jgi:hypothetical protein